MSCLAWTNEGTGESEIAVEVRNAPPEISENENSLRGAAADSEPLDAYNELANVTTSSRITFRYANNPPKDRGTVQVTDPGNTLLKHLLGFWKAIILQLSDRVLFFFPARRQQ